MKRELFSFHRTPLSSLYTRLCPGGVWESRDMGTTSIPLPQPSQPAAHNLLPSSGRGSSCSSTTLTAPPGAPILAATSQRRTPDGWPGWAVARTPRSLTAQPGSPAQPDHSASPGSLKKKKKMCFLLLRTSHSETTRSVSARGCTARPNTAPDKQTHSSFSGWLISDTALEPGRDFWAFGALRQ